MTSMTSTYSEIERDEMPIGSFVYGQLASIDGVAAPADKWLVCTPCSKPKNPDDNGASGFDEILVAQFVNTREDDARETAASLALSGHKITLVKPAPVSDTFTVSSGQAGYAVWGRAVAVADALESRDEALEIARLLNNDARTNLYFEMSTGGGNETHDDVYHALMAFEQLVTSYPDTYAALTIGHATIAEHASTRYSS
jgi:hypothetical protein